MPAEETHPALKRFGINVRALREKQEISQERLAEIADLDRTYVGGLERGERNLQQGISEKIADPDHPQISPHDDSLAPSHGKMPPQIPIECFVPCRRFNHSKQNPLTQK